MCSPRDLQSVSGSDPRVAAPSQSAGEWWRAIQPCLGGAPENRSHFQMFMERQRAAAAEQQRGWGRSQHGSAWEESAPRLDLQGLKA